MRHTWMTVFVLSMNLRCMRHRGNAGQSPYSQASHPHCACSCVCCRCRQDLDLLIELQSSRDCFEAFENDRMECLDAVCNLLCTPAAPPLDSMTSTLDAAQLAGSGWELRLALPHYMQLSHPVLQLQLDIQVGTCYDNSVVRIDKASTALDIALLNMACVTAAVRANITYVVS